MMKDKNRTMPAKTIVSSSFGQYTNPQRGGKMSPKVVIHGLALHRALRLTKTTDNCRYAIPAALALAHLAF